MYRIDLDERVGGRVSRFSVETFLSHSTDKFRRETLYGVTNFEVSNTFPLQSVMSRLFVETSVLQFRKSLQGNPSRLRFGKIPLAKKFIDKKWGEYQDFPSKVFCLTVPKKAVGESFSLSIISCIEKIWMGGLAGVSRSSVELFLFEQCRKITQGYPLVGR